MERFDLIVLGGGTAGAGMVRRAAAKGWKIAIVEAEHLGGTCINVGCIPSKTLISSAKVMQSVRDAKKYGVMVDPPRADWTAMIERKEQLVGKMRDRLYKNINRKDNIKLYEGEAVFTGQNTLKINDKSITAEKIVIATGARTAVPSVPGLKDIDYLTSTSVMEMNQLPKSLLILGGGIIALEFSQLFARLGVKVTIIQRDDRLATNLEPEISDEIRNIFESTGIVVKTNTNISSAGTEGGSVYVIDETNNGQVRYSADQILVATGRTPNSDKLGLDKTNVKVDIRGYIEVDENFRTSDEGIWAIGDVIGGMMFTHKAGHDALLLSRHLLKNEKIDPKNRLIPFAVFTEPEIAGVGMGEASAVEAGYEIKVQRFPFSHHGRSLATNKLDGFVKLVIESGNGKILGAHIFGPEAGELIHELITAMNFGATVYDLQDMIHIHPTLSEAIIKTALSE